MWKPEHRRAASRTACAIQVIWRDSEWALIEPAIPPAKLGGRRRECERPRGLTRSSMCLDRLQWQALPKDLPPKSHRASYFMPVDWDGTLERIHHALYVETASAKAARRADGRDHRQPECQSRSKGAALDPQGFDCGQEGHRAQAPHLVDTLGLLLNVVVHPANVQDTTGEAGSRSSTRCLFPFIERIFADAGYQATTASRAPLPARPLGGRDRQRT